MKLSRKYRPELLVSEDPTRLSICDVHFDVETSRLVATNGVALVAVPVEKAPTDTAGSVTPEDLARARKLKGDVVLEVTAGKVRTLDGVESPRRDPKDLPFPDYMRVLPPFDVQSRGTVTVGFQVDLLLDLVKALGCSESNHKHAVELTFNLHRNDSPIVVHVEGQDERAKAILMPMRCAQKGAFDAEKRMARMAKFDEHPRQVHALAQALRDIQARADVPLEVKDKARATLKGWEDVE